MPVKNSEFRIKNLEFRDGLLISKAIPLFNLLPKIFAKAIDANAEPLPIPISETRLKTLKSNSNKFQRYDVS